MRRFVVSTLLAVAVFLLTAATAFADNWPPFLRPP